MTYNTNRAAGEVTQAGEVTGAGSVTQAGEIRGAGQVTQVDEEAGQVECDAMIMDGHTMDTGALKL